MSDGATGQIIFLKLARGLKIRADTLYELAGEMTKRSTKLECCRRAALLQEMSRACIIAAKTPNSEI